MLMDPFGLAAARFDKPATGPRDPVHPGWPESTPTVRLATGETLRLRPLTNRDGADWAEIRLLDEQWLRPVEPTTADTWKQAHSAASWRNNFSYLRGLASRGVAVPLAIELDGAFAGQTTIGNIQHGAVSEAWIGYWVHSIHMGKGVATAACALGTDHAFSRIGLHRVTATYLPSNPASGKVLMTAGFREEGLLRRNLHIDGEWRDHIFVAQNVEDHPDTCVARLRSAGRLL